MVGVFRQRATQESAGDWGAAATDRGSRGDSPGASWGESEVIVFGADGGSVLMQVAAAGGTPKPVSAVDTTIGETAHRWPDFFPGGDAVAFTSWSGSNETARIAVLSLASGRVTRLAEPGVNPHYAANGHLVYTRSDQSVVGVPFDIRNMAVTGQSVPLLEDVTLGAGGVAELAVSTTGALVYVPGGLVSRRTMVLVDRRGNESPLTEVPRPYWDPRFSPTGNLVAVEVDDAIRVYDLAQGTLSARTFEGNNDYPAWTPDGNRLIFSSERGQTRSLYSVPADGSRRAEPFFETETDIWESALSPDGQWLAIRTGIDGDILVVSLEEEDRSPRPYIKTSFNERMMALSPAGRWLAYVSDESGQDEVHVRAFPEPAAQVQVSVRGGREPVWSRSGRELFYRTSSGLMAAAVQTAPVFRVTQRELLFEDNYFGRGLQDFAEYDVDPQSGRFLMIKSPDDIGKVEMVVVTNWFEELRRKMEGQ